MAPRSTHNQIEEIQITIKDIVNLAETLDEKTIRQNPSDDEWSILQILSHLAEAIPYWVHEVRQVVEAPGSQWGRGLQDPKRLKAVEDTEQLSIEKTIEKVAQLQIQVEKLSSLNKDQLKAKNPHRNFEKFGDKPVSFIIDHFINEHVEKHHGQIKRNLSKLN